MEIFGYEVLKKDQTPTITFASRDQDDGSIVVEGPGSQAYGAYAIALDFEGTIASEVDTINKYLDTAMIPEVDYAIDDIINEFVSIDDDTPITIDLDQLEYSDGVKDKFRDEFQRILDLLDFRTNGYQIIKNWYVTGRLYYHIAIDDKNFANEGMKELINVDPRKIKKIREIVKDIHRGTLTQTIKDEYYVYSDEGFKSAIGAVSTTGTKITKDSICSLTSGIMSKDGTMVLSHLHKALRPLNMLRNLEDASIIYRLARAPERRVFYIDVANLPKAKAEQHLTEVMNKYKNKLVYDSASGNIRDDRKFMTMTEDYFLPRRSDGKATEITTLPGGANLGEMEEVTYFLNKFYRALNIPIGRLDPQSGFQLGRATEIARDEVKFNKFINRLRNRFSIFLLDLLGRQLVLKNIVRTEDWEVIKKRVTFDYATDNTFAEIKNTEIMEMRLGVLDRAAPYKGEYFSKQWLERKVLYMSDEDVEQIEKDIADDPDGNMSKEEKAAELEAETAPSPTS